MVEKATLALIKRKHGAYASWAVWTQPTGRPKSNTGDLSVLDPELNPALLRTLRPAVVMLALNLSRFSPVPFGNFHDASPESQDYKIRYAFTDTPYYGAYMTDLIKEVVMVKSNDLKRHIAANPSLLAENVRKLLEEFDDLGCASPTVIAFGKEAHRLAARHVPSSRYSRLVGITHYGHYISREHYREQVLAEIGSE
jgi:hypothetical protein